MLSNIEEPTNAQIRKTSEGQEEPLYRARLGHKGRGPKRILTKQGKENYDKIKWD
jgi:hypothetical protein